jgi:toxin YoeB
MISENNNTNARFEYTIILSKKAMKDLEKITKNKKLLLKLEEILNELKSNPYSPQFKFEKLRYNNSGFYSKRLTKKDRIVYSIEDNIIQVSIVSIIGHYDDK